MCGRRTTPLETDRLREACLETLRALGRTVTAQLLSRERTATLRLKLGASAPRFEFEVRTTRTHLSYPLATGFIEEARRAEGRWLLFAPYVPAPIGQHLVSHGLSYVDAVGNCHIETDERLLVHVEGKKQTREPGVRSPGVTSHQLLFALLAQPDLVEAPVRKVALAAGIGKSAALEQLGRLNTQDMLDYYPAKGLVRGRELLDRWLTAYVEAARPSWLVARCRPQVTDPDALDAQIEQVCEKRVWAFGGAAAACRMVPCNRGRETVLHVAEAPDGLLEQLQVVRAPNGPLTILQIPGALAYQGTRPHLAHPLLVYTELLTSTEARVTAVANSIREQFLAQIA
jgi:hypothetical protein